MTRRAEGPASEVGRILIVEDSPSARRLLQDVLLRLGAEIPSLRLATTIVEAMTVFSQWRPDVAFVDVELREGPTSPLGPEIAPASDRDPKDGIELALLFRSRNPATRLIICSAKDPSDERITRLVREQQVEVIVKPVIASRVEDVLLAISSQMARSSGGPRARRE
jgi:CheY-like chemotaxis protein